jgi:hypothetical protein
MVALEQRRPEVQTGAIEAATCLMLEGKKPTLEGEGAEGQCSCEGTLLCRGNPARKAFDKPMEVLSLVGKKGKLCCCQWSGGE